MWDFFQDYVNIRSKNQCAKVMCMGDKVIRGYMEVFFKNRNFMVLASLY